MNAFTPDAAQALAQVEPDRNLCPHWGALLKLSRGAAESLPAGSDLVSLYGPLCAIDRGRPFAIAHLAQSLDGRIATTSGVSRWLSGDADLLHTHRMRALADAVLVGASTVHFDDPQLTVRRCQGENPVRVIIDAECRLDGSQRVFRDGAAPTLVLVAADRAAQARQYGQAEVIALPRTSAGFDPQTIRSALAHRGLNWLFIEGGGATVSRFIEARALDRLQITIAPVIMGSGRPSIALPEISDLNASLRPTTRRFDLGADTLIECVFND
jgi:riboflavin-specific deaminase-like protein